MVEYPPPPWRLAGHATHTLGLAPVGAARTVVPPSLRVVQALPGFTLAGIGVARYVQGSTLEYGELAVIPAVVRTRAGIGLWVSHMYVDNPRSLAGGRQIWGLPKELAEFHWSDDGVVVSRGGDLLCRIVYARHRGHVPFAASGWCYGLPSRVPTRFDVTLSSRLSAARCEWTCAIPDFSLSNRFSGRRLTLVHDNLRFRVEPPRPST